jgi:murein DD-endopeptidase MepM/ murein hydrolase activator NlpD
MAVLTVSQAYYYAGQAGFNTNAQKIIVAIAQAESGLDTLRNSPPNNDQWHSIDRGILQINNHWHAEYSDSCCHDAQCSFNAAFVISSSGTNFDAWTTYTTKDPTISYKRFLPGGSSNPSNANQTIADVFHAKGLWLWWEQNGGKGTNLYNGVTEKGIDYANVFGTPIGVAVGGKIVRLVHHTDSQGDVTELEADDGSIWLYQHITAKVKVGDKLGVGGIIGTENGLPIDQFSTGAHIEVRYCPPGRWNPNIDSWVEPWVNPYAIFSTLSSKNAGKVDTSGALLGGALSNIPIKLGPNANVTGVLIALDELGHIKNPFDLGPDGGGDSIPIITGISGSTFPDPIKWLGLVGSNLFSDTRAMGFRLLLLLVGAFLLYKAFSQFVDLGAVTSAAGNIGKSAALFL